jgi:hypothetical protein
MVRVLAVVEGPTERDFCRTLLAPHLGGRNVDFSARVIGKPGHKGGVPNWERAKKEITELLRTAPALTTMFDLYALPMSWPGRSEAARRACKTVTQPNTSSDKSAKPSRAKSQRGANRLNSSLIYPFTSSRHSYLATPLFSPVLPETATTPRSSRTLLTSAVSVRGLTITLTRNHRLASATLQRATRKGLMDRALPSESACKRFATSARTSMPG